MQEPNPANALIHTDHTPLETGWLTSTPDGDNIVLDTSRAMARAYHALAEAGNHRTHHDDALGLTLTDSGSPTPFGNMCHISSPLDRESAGQLGRELRDFFSDSPGGPFILFSPFPTGDLREIDLSPVGHPPLMVRWNALSSRPRSDLDVRTVTDVDGLADFERTLIEAYPVAELQPWRPGVFVGSGALESGWTFVVGYDEGQPVAVAASFSTGHATLIEMVAARESVRGRGFGAAVTAAAAGSDATRPAVLISSDPGRSVYAGLGFVPISRFTAWVGHR